MAHYLTVFVPLKKMPLTPNGKIDKPALPFPDTFQSLPPAPTTPTTCTPTETKIRSIWSGILPNSSTEDTIPLDESFFDLGGHSILATRLIFEIRKAFVVNAPLGLVFQEPTVRGLARAVEELRNADLGLGLADDGTTGGPSASAVSSNKAKEFVYYEDYETLVQKLRPSYSPLPADFNDHPLTVFLTGATGFLGAFVLRDLLRRVERVKKVIVLIRAQDSDKALTRIRELSLDREVWDEAWITEGRLEVVLGDLALPQLGLQDSDWSRIAAEADVVLHNGALVSLQSLSFEFRADGFGTRFIGFIPTKSCAMPMSLPH